MAEQHGGAARNQQPIEAADAFAAPGNHDRAHRLCLDSGLVLMLCAIPTAFGFDPTRGGGAAANIALIGFLLWILGTCMCLLALTPAAPWAVRAGAAIASNVPKYLSLL